MKDILLLLVFIATGLPLALGRQNPPQGFREPPSDAVDHVDPYVHRSMLE